MPPPLGGCGQCQLGGHTGPLDPSSWADTVQRFQPLWSHQVVTGLSGPLCSYLEGGYREPFPGAVLGQQALLEPGFRPVCQAADDKPFPLLQQTPGLGFLPLPGPLQCSPGAGPSWEEVAKPEGVRSVGELLGALTWGLAAHLPLTQADWSLCSLREGSPSPRAPARPQAVAARIGHS